MLLCILKSLNIVVRMKLDYQSFFIYFSKISNIQYVLFKRIKFLNFKESSYRSCEGSMLLITDGRDQYLDIGQTYLFFTFIRSSASL